MKALVKNFRGVTEIFVDIAPIALLCGTNGAGKTSIAKAIAAAATGRAVPFPKITKKDCAIMLRHGTHDGQVMLEGAEGTTLIEWPQADVKSTGQPPVASEIATGLTDLFSMKEDQALSYLITLLKASPTQGDLQTAFGAAGVVAGVADQVWKVIDAQGWDAAHKRAVETGQQRKGAWQQITGTGYGKKKAEEWFPEGWEDLLLKRSLADIDGDIDGANEKLESEIGKSAVSKAEREACQKLVDNSEAIALQLTEKQTAMGKEQDALAKVEKELQTTPDPNAKQEYACPHCEKPVHVSPSSPGKFVLSKASNVEGAAAKKVALKRAELDGAAARLRSAIETIRREVFELTRIETETTIAKGKLENLGDAQEGDQAAIAALRAEIAQLQKSKALILKWQEAKKAADQINVNQVIVDLLDETGIRKKKLAQCLDAFISNYIDPLCSDFGVPIVTIDSDLLVDMGGTPYSMLSASEQFRVRTILQLAIAQIEKASIVIIDGADILDREGRQNLLSTVQTAGIPAVICMTLNKPDQAPDLAENEIGMTYWIEKGKCRQLSAEKKAA